MPVGFLLIAAAFSAIVMLLWNWLMPALFELAVINFWQAAGLFILARILFGGFGWGKMMRHPMHGHHANHIREKWEKMTPEQREKLMKKLDEKRRKFGFGGPFGREHFGMEHEEHGKENE